MIYKLQKRFILISAISIFSVIVLVFGLMTLFNVSSMNKMLDTLADRVSEGSGKFPDSFGGNRPHKPDKMEFEPEFDFITPETRFSTRHFTVWFDCDGTVTKTNTESIYTVTEDDAVEYAKAALESGNARGWNSSYRYKVFFVEDGMAVVFIDGSMNMASFWRSITISAFVLLGCAALVLLLIILLSKRVVKPIAESYEKQRQFVTDANHELKTPLTLILANLDIAEAELGKNEWLSDIREEGQRMTELVNQLVSLSRMDEDGQKIDAAELPISEIVADTVSDFRGLSEERGKAITTDIDPGILYTGDEVLIRRLLSILLDNAIKYCDENGCISVTLTRKRNVVLTVENTYREVDSVALERLFDRFYRADQARTYTGGYGVGLSIAKAIVRKHHGEITAYKKNSTQIGFRVVLKN